MPAQHFLLFLPQGVNLFRMNGLLGKNRAVAFRFFECVRPLSIQFRKFFRRKKFRLDDKFLFLSILEKRRLNQCLVDRVLLVRYRHDDPQLLMDGFTLFQNDLQNKAVHGVILTINHGAADFFRLLSETIDAPFTLFVSRRIPRKVVVHDRREVLLQIDTFGEAVRCHENPFLGIAHRFHPSLTVFRGQFPGHAVHRHVLRQRFLQGFLHILRRGNETAENHRGKAVFEERLHMTHQKVQLRVIRTPRQALCFIQQSTEFIVLFKTKRRFRIRIASLIQFLQIRIDHPIVRHVACRCFQPIFERLFRCGR